jgi:hypothetical protein
MAHGTGCMPITMAAYDMTRNRGYKNPGADVHQTDDQQAAHR